MKTFYTYTVEFESSVLFDEADLTEMKDLINEHLEVCGFSGRMCIVWNRKTKNRKLRLYYKVDGSYFSGSLSSIERIFSEARDMGNEYLEVRSINNSFSFIFERKEK